MADIIDAFVVSLGLDARQYNDEIKKFKKDQKDLRDQAAKDSKAVERQNTQMAQGFRSVRNEVAGLFLAFAGASSLKSFVTDMLSGDAATGRLARNLDLSTNRLHAWQEGLKSVGGTANDANSSLQTVVSTLADAVYRGDYSKGFNLAALGMSYGDLKDPDQALLKMAAAGEHMSRIKFVNILTALGINPNTINLLELGRTDLEKLLREKERDAPLTKKQTDEAEAYQKSLAALATEIQGETRPWVQKFADTVTGFLATNKDLNIALPILVAGVTAIGVAAAIAVGPWALLAATIAGAAVAANSFLEATAKGAIDPNDPNGKFKHDQAGYLLAARNALARGDVGEAAHQMHNAWLNGMDASRRAHGGTSAPNQMPDPVPSGSGGAPVAGASIVSQLMAAGFTREQARGISAGIGAESGYRAQARNPTSGAYGLGQWLGSRKKELIRRYGPAPSPEQQMEFLIWELKGGDKGGPSVGRQATADHALLAYVHNFMRPGPGAMGDMARGRSLLAGRPIGVRTGGGNRSVSQTTSVGQITIVVPNGDPDTIAKGVRGALAKHEIVTQANSGMTP